jgi:4'-phosphopantetheinyl transferase
MEPPPEPPAEAVVEAWWADLDAVQEEPRTVDATLSEDERARMARFRFEDDRRRYGVRHLLLRRLLARYVDQPPEALRFTSNAYGKPALAGATLRFNASSSGRLALYVVARDREVGCDVERRRSGFAGDEVARQFFSPAEIEALTALGPGRRLAAFFDCWTRKEAYVKARGLGLSLPLDSFDVSLTPGETPALLRAGDGWSIRAFRLAARHHACVAAEGADWRLRLQRLTGEAKGQ